MNDFCQPRSEYDEAVCECMFEILDEKMTKSVGQTWIYNPKSMKHPAFNTAMNEAEKCNRGY